VREQILDRNPSASLHVYVVWLPMLAPDARSEWDSSVLPDERVTHFWDGERIAGIWLAQRDVGGLGYSGVVWDAFFVFGPEASWGDEPGPLLASGAPVIDHSAELGDALLPLLEREQGR
jgi:hypothetical protein